MRLSFLFSPLAFPFPTKEKKKKKKGKEITKIFFNFLNFFKGFILLKEKKILFIYFLSIFFF